MRLFSNTFLLDVCKMSLNTQVQNNVLTRIFIRDFPVTYSKLSRELEAEL